MRFCLSMSRSGGRTRTMGTGHAGSVEGWRRARGEAGRAERSAGADRRVDADRGPGTPAQSGPRSGGEAAGGGRIETTREELTAIEVIRRLLGPTRPVAYEDTVSYFKIHLAERYTWVMRQLSLGRKRPSVCVPWPQEQVQAPTPFGRRQFRLTNGAGRPFDPAGSPRSAKGRSNVPVRHRDRPSPGRRPDRVKSEAHRRERTRTARPCTLRPGTATTQAVGPVRSGDRRGRAGP